MTLYCLQSEETRRLILELRDRRKSLGMSFTEAADRAGFTKSVVEKLEGGKIKGPTLEHLHGLARAVGCQVKVEIVG